MKLLHALDPVAFYIAFIPVRWYSLSYFFGILLGVLYLRTMYKYAIPESSRKQLGFNFEDIALYLTLGIILGARLGAVLFYNPEFYLKHPVHVLYLWHGGMSFHGGLLGVVLAIWLFVRKYRLDFIRFMDVAAPAATIGLFLGRLANFVNGELYGKVTNVPWGVVFPYGGPVPRHPTQIYEALLEGVLLFIILHILLLKYNRRGVVSSAFLILYCLMRCIVEYFREPDDIGYIAGCLTMGQLLSMPMAAMGIILYIMVVNKSKGSYSKV